jgi:hypothetical protein
LHATDEKIGKQIEAINRQLDISETDKRPWIKVQITLRKNILFSEWSNEKSIQVPLNLEFKNYGAVPAINLQVLVMTGPRLLHPKEVTVAAQRICDNAGASAAEQSAPTGLAVFPGESESTTTTVGNRYWDLEGQSAFSVYGCLDYTYGNSRHGQTAFRMILGRSIDGHIRGLPFVSGPPRPYEEAVSPELLAQGFPKDPPKIGMMPTTDLIFERDALGGNYAK